MLKRRQEIDNTQLREQTNLIWLSVDIRHAHASRFIDKSLFRRFSTILNECGKLSIPWSRCWDYCPRVTTGSCPYGHSSNQKTFYQVQISYFRNHNLRYLAALHRIKLNVIGQEFSITIGP